MNYSYSYKELAYLLGCYIVIADKDINEQELNILDEYVSLSSNDNLYQRRAEIFSDDEVRISKKDLYYHLQLKNLSNVEKEEIMDLVIRVAYGDNFVSKQEAEIINKVSNVLNFNSDEIIKRETALLNSRIDKSRLSTLQRFVGNVENKLYEKLSSKHKEKLLDWLLDSQGYSTNIENITNNAVVDLQRISKIMKEINTKLEITISNLSNAVKIGRDSSKEVQDVAEIIQSTKENFQEILNESLAGHIEVIEKKRRNIRYFTIAFMGRTKAGKSTLHKVVTQQDDDDIGVGKLRTTRYNRSWYWEQLRIVDTPGIGAPGGDVDTECAKSIIDEADIICYVVTSDSIQETEFDFFETIKERNKPLYIILNVKSNLYQKIRFERFLENPSDWRECKGPKSIQGHLDRIHDKLDGKYNMDAVKIIPLHLLAAQLGLTGDFDAQKSQRLVDGSNIMDFIRSIKREVHRSGNIKKV